jgi:Aromatic-ring-opening dioxygenase LigAB, LigA subunit
MSESLSDFLVDLVSNPDQMAAFLADPDRVFDAAGLTAEERDAIRSRDARRLSAALNPGLHLEANNNNLTIKRTPSKAVKKKGAKKKGAAKKKKGGRKGGSKKR